MSSPNVPSPNVNTEEQQLNQLLSSGVMSTFCNNTVIQHYTVTCTIQIFLTEEAKDILVFDYTATGCLSNRHITVGGACLTFDFEKRYDTIEEAAAFDSRPGSRKKCFH